MLEIIMDSGTSQCKNDIDNSLTYAGMISISENYIDVLVQNGKLKNGSATNYKGSIECFIKWLSNKNNDFILDIAGMYTRYDVIDFIKYKYNNGLSVKSLTKYTSMLYCLNRALKIEGYNVPNIAGLSLNEILKES